MTNSDINKDLEVDVEYIQEKLHEGYKNTQGTKGQNLVLVVGNSGVGKSTTCNYLSSSKMTKMKYKLRPVIDTVKRTDIKIGHEVKSETLYAKPVLIQPCSICLLDCPGFYGNRTVEEKVIESISTEMAIRNAQDVKGILILISFNVLRETRVTELRELVKTLICLFKDPEDMVKYSIFVITKRNEVSEPEAKETTIGALESLKYHCQEQATLLYENPNLSSSENLTANDYGRIATYFSTVLEMQKNILFINPLDEGESRELIFNKINAIEPRRGIVNERMRNSVEDQEIQPITINDFNFSESNEYRVLFNKALYHLADDGQKIISKICEAKQTTEKLYLDISDGEERKFKLLEEQAAIEKDLDKSSEGKVHSNLKIITSWKSLILQNKKWIESKQKELEEIIQNRMKIDKELQAIDRATPLKFVEKSICKDISLWNIFGWEEMKFSADTRDRSIPIIQVNISMENGRWIKKDDRRAAGIFHITYKSDFRARPARASVKSFIKTRDECGNRLQIKRIKENDAEFTVKQTELESALKLLQSSNEVLESNIKQAETNAKGYKTTLKKELEKCKDDIEHYSSEILRKKKELENAKDVGLTSLKLFDNDERKFDTLVSISTFLEFPSLLIKRFTSNYDAFLSDINNYRSCFGEQDVVNLSSMRKKEEIIFGLKDPITGNEIKDLVITFDGTPFDEHSLLGKFNTSMSGTPPPIIFKHIDGSEEKIEYLGWTKMKRQRRKEFSSSKFPSYSYDRSKHEITQMTEEELIMYRDRVMQEVLDVRENLELKELTLEKIVQQLKKVQMVASENIAVGT